MYNTTTQIKANKTLIFFWHLIDFLFAFAFQKNTQSALQAEGPRFEPVCSHEVPVKVSSN